MAAQYSKWSWGAVLAGVAVLAAGAAVAVPALAGGKHREQVRRPTLATLARQVASLRSQDAMLRRRITALSKKGSVAGPAGVAGPTGPGRARGRR